VHREPDGRTCAEGYGALYADDVPGTWIDAQCFAASLPFQGVGASSHAAEVTPQAEPVKFLFGSVVKTDANGVKKLYEVQDFTEIDVGDISSDAAAANGMFPGDAWFSYQSDWGSRSYGVGYDGRSQWFVNLDGDGKADYVYNRDDTRENWAMTSQSCPAAVSR
jgi:hypothetical protein